MQQLQRTDENLVRRAAGGELRAFEELVERHTAVVLRVASRIVGPTHAEDVAQDAFLRAFHRLDQYRGDAPFRAWLLRVTRNTALNWLEREAARPVLSKTDPDDVEREHVVPGTPAERLEEDERRARLLWKIRQLRPEHRAVLVLRDLEDLSYDEIADATGAPLGSVKGRLHRARGELIEILRNNTYDWGLPRERE